MIMVWMVESWPVILKFELGILLKCILQGDVIIQHHISQLRDCTRFNFMTSYRLVNRDQDPLHVMSLFIYHSAKVINDNDPKLLKYPNSNTGSFICDFTNTNVSYRCNLYHLKSMSLNFNKRYCIGTKSFCPYGLILVRVFIYVISPGNVVILCASDCT